MSNPLYPTAVVEREMPAGAVGDINSTAKGSGARYNAGKAPLDLIPLTIIAESYAVARALPPTTGGDVRMTLLYLGRWQETGDDAHLYGALLALGPLKETWEACAKVLKYGLAKYAPWNWAKGMAWSIPLACAARHCTAVLNGEEMDPESNELHLGHVAANIVMLLVFQRTYPEGDDRPRTLA